MNTVQVENLRRGRAYPVKTRRTITNHSGGCRWSGADYFQPLSAPFTVQHLSFVSFVHVGHGYMCILFSYRFPRLVHTAKNFRPACQFFSFFFPRDIRSRW